MSDANGWRPIDTAPESDCVDFLVWDGFGPVIVHRFFETLRSAHGNVKTATHWQPLPGAPEVGGSGESLVGKRCWVRASEAHQWKGPLVVVQFSPVHGYVTEDGAIWKSAKALRNPPAGE